MCDTAAVVGVLRALVREGVAELTIPAFVHALGRRVPCSRRTAYRALHRARAEGVARFPEF